MNQRATAMANPLVAAVVRFAGGLRFPTLFKLTLALFLLNLIVPDPIPYADEVLLGLFTLMLGSMKFEKSKPKSESRDLRVD